MTMIDETRNADDARKINERYARETTVLLAFIDDEESTAWMSLGACADVDAELFFSYPDDAPEPDYPSDEAKAVCFRCPVKDICLGWALKHPEIVGVWGGTSSYQREQMRRRRARKSCPGCSATTVILSARNQLCLSCGASWPA